MGNRTPLYQMHLDAGAKMVDFGGWDMPLHYGSQIEEHLMVRADSGVFDVSHMTVVDVAGSDASAFLQYLLANDVAKLTKPGKGLYSCMLNEQGGVIDDLIVYLRANGGYRVIVNAATRESDIAWMQKVAADFDVSVDPAEGYVMLAVQGPTAVKKAIPLLPAELHEAAEALKPFQACENDNVFVARTGYTGEDGLEVVLPATDGLEFWVRLLTEDVKPAGLGARDTLRLEAGLNLYGQDMDASVTPLESGLAWTVAWDPADRDFIGRAALEAQKAAGPEQRFVGLLLQGRGIMRHGQRVVTAAGDGEITSGSFSPTMEQTIALARVPAEADGECQVEIRNKLIDARIVKPAFVRKGQILD